MEFLLRGGRLIDARVDSPEEQSCDVLIADGIIKATGKGLTTNGRVIDCQDQVVAPGFIDLHVHFREPGFEYKEDISTGARAAVDGGFTTVCCMPNTNPINDCRAVSDLIVTQAKKAGLARVLPIGAITKGSNGKLLAEYGEMKEAGIVALSDDGKPVMHAGLMRRALEYAKTFSLPMVQHAEDLDLAEGGVMHEGDVSSQLGLKGQPRETESIMVARDIELVGLTGAQYHVAHISAARSVEMVRDAKRRGLPVTSEVTPHHFTLTDVACCGYDTSAKVMPPLRTQEDIDALLVGLADGTIDCIATDHAPHASVDKDLDFSCAAPGMLGLGTALPLANALVGQGVISLSRMVQLFTKGAADVFHLKGLGQIAEGGIADVCVFDPKAKWTFDAGASASRSDNSPFHGREVVGRVNYTFCGGRLVMEKQR